MRKIKLTDKEKKIVMMLDEMPVSKSIYNIKEQLKIGNEELIKIIEKLETIGIIKKCINNNEFWYFYNNKKVNDKLRFNLNMGYEFGKSVKNGPISKLRKFTKNK